MILEPIKPEVLAVRIIPNVDPQLASSLKLEPRHRAIGMITCNIDDSLYAALDEGTKMAPVDVVYAKSFYAGAAHASGPFSGEIIGIFAGEDEESVSSGVQACLRYLDKKAWFYAATDDNALAFFPHVIPSIGSYLADAAGVPTATSMAYLIAPPIEAILALDAALKVAEVEMKVFYPPPSETNFSGGLLVGPQPAVEAAAQAFQDKVLELATNPLEITPAPEVEEMAEQYGRLVSQRGTDSDLPYRLLASGMAVEDKPQGYTHLRDNASLVPKGFPVIRFRGKMDLLQAYVLDAAVESRREGRYEISDDLAEILQWLRRLMSAEVLGSDVPELTIGGLTADELHRVSHNTPKFLAVGWVMPHPDMGSTVAKLNLLRAFSREVELAALDTFPGSGHLTEENTNRLLHGLNRLSNAIYVIVCKMVGQLKAN